MKSGLVLEDDGFRIEFYTFKDSQQITCWRDRFLADDHAHVLQEIFVLPPGMIGDARKYSASSAAPSRCITPFVFAGEEGSSFQYAATVARIETEKARIDRSDQAIKISSGGINFLYSAPIFSGDPNTKQSFNGAFHRISEIGERFQMGESSIARTWLFLRDILGDYEKLNSARENFFSKWHSAKNKFLPASTGIQNRIVGNEILAFGFCAFSGDKVEIRQISSPLQNEPTSYGKLFSRAVVVQFSGPKLLFISGTAAINKSGLSVHQGDFQSQLAFTLEVISAILRTEGCDFSGIVQSIVYLKRSGDMTSCLKILERTGFPADKALFQTGVDICREDLLCEIEAIAAIN